MAFLFTMNLCLCSAQFKLIPPSEQEWAPNLNEKSKLMYLDFTSCQWNSDTEKMLASCYNLQKLSLRYLLTISKTINDICKQNANTLQVLDLSCCSGLYLDSVKDIVTNCEELKEVNFADTYLRPESISFLVNNLTDKIEKLNLSSLDCTDRDIQVLLSRWVLHDRKYIKKAKVFQNCKKLRP